MFLLRRREAVLYIIRGRTIEQCRHELKMFNVVEGRYHTTVETGQVGRGVEMVREGEEGS